MHETEGADSVVEEGKKRFIDIDLPGTPGSVMNAEFANAIQEEFRNVLIEAGLTFEGTAAADRAAGWVQLRNAIFRSAAIDTPAIKNAAVTNEKIDTLDLAKMFGVLDLQGTPGPGFALRMLLDDTDLSFHFDYNGNENRDTVVDAEGLRSSSDANPGITLTPEGYANKAVTDSPPLKVSVIEINDTDPGWQYIGGDTSIWNGVTTGIPKNKRIHNVVFSVEDTSNGTAGEFSGPVYSFSNGPTSLSDPQDTYYCRVSSKDASEYWSLTIVVDASLNDPVYEKRSILIVHE